MGSQICEYKQTSANVYLEYTLYLCVHISKCIEIWNYVS